MIYKLSKSALFLDSSQAHHHHEHMFSIIPVYYLNISGFDTLKYNMLFDEIKILLDKYLVDILPHLDV